MSTRAADTSEPHVTVLLPVHQGEAFLAEAIESILGQTFRDFELLIVDDGSSDGTAKIIEGCSDPRVRATTLGRQHGLVHGLNLGLDLARGRYVARMDADDISLPQRLERQIDFLDAHPDIGACGSWAETFGDTPGERLEFPTEPDEIRCRLLFENVLAHPTVCLRAASFRRHGLRFEAEYRHAEDYRMWQRASDHFPLANLDEVLLRYRVHTASVTRRHAAEQRQAVAAIQEDALRQLGLSPTAQDLRLHGADSADGGPAPALADVETWLLGLMRANRIAERYPPDLFDHAVRRRWTDAANRCVADGRPGAARVVRSRLWRGVPLGDRGLWLARATAQSLRRTSGILRPASPGVEANDERPLRIVLPDLLGGVTSYTLDLATLPAVRSRGVQLLWVRDRDTAGSARAETPRTSVPDHTLRHDWPAENLFAVLRRMHRVLGQSDGPLIANEFFGLAYAARHAHRATTVQILHGDSPMYYELAERFEPYVDAFVAVSATIADELCRRLPARKDDVHHLPSGVPRPARQRSPVAGTLRLVYTGRIDRDKGVLEFGAIDRKLREAGVPAVWTIIGAGPDDEALHASFAPEARVEFAGALGIEDCRGQLADHDVFVLPSYKEGLPLSLLEAMAAGLVPVVSDLESGIREVVRDGTGIRVTPGNVQGFADAIARLHRDRNLLESSSRRAAACVRDGHSLDVCGTALLEWLRALEARPAEAKRDKPNWSRGPSRLDRPWLPNAVVRSIRSLTS